MTDDDIPIHVVTDAERRDHYRRFHPGTPAVQQEGPMITLPKERFEELEQQVESLLASRKTMNRLVWLAIPGLIGALVTVLLFAADKIASSSRHAGETEADMRNLKEQLEHQRAEIIELRATLYRKSGADPHSLPNSDMDDPDAWFDKLSTVDRAAPQSVPASGGGPNGVIGTVLHRPALQNRHTLPNWEHSALLEQMFRHPPSGLGLGAAGGADELQAARAITTTDTM